MHLDFFSEEWDRNGLSSSAHGEVNCFDCPFDILICSKQVGLSSLTGHYWRSVSRSHTVSERGIPREYVPRAIFEVIMLFTSVLHALTTIKLNSGLGAKQCPGGEGHWERWLQFACFAGEQQPGTECSVPERCRQGQNIQEENYKKTLEERSGNETQQAGEEDLVLALLTQWQCQLETQPATGVQTLANFCLFHGEFVCGCMVVSSDVP